MIDSLLANPLSKIILFLSLLICFALIVALIADADDAVQATLEGLVRPISGLGDGIFALFQGIGSFITEIGAGIGEAIVKAVDNVTGGTALRGIICAIFGNCDCDCL